MKDDAADDALPGRGLEPDLDFAAQEVEFRLHGGRITTRADGVFGAGRRVVDDCAGRRVPGAAGGVGGEVKGVGEAERGVGRTAAV